MITRQLSHLRSQYYKNRRKLIKFLAVQLKQNLPATLWNNLVYHLADQHPLYHRKLKNHLPDSLKKQFSSDIWELIAEYGFDLNSLRCPLSGELLINSVDVGTHHYKIMQIVYDENYLQAVKKAQNEMTVEDYWRDNTELGSVHWHLMLHSSRRRRWIRAYGLTVRMNDFTFWKTAFIDYLTTFALMYRKISLTDAADDESQTFLAKLQKENKKWDNRYYPSFNIVEALGTAIDIAKSTGETQFDLAGFFNRYEYPVIGFPGNGLSVDEYFAKQFSLEKFANFLTGYMIGAASVVGLHLIYFTQINATKWDEVVLYKYVESTLGILLAIALACGNLLHLADRVMAAARFEKAEFWDLASEDLPVFLQQFPLVVFQGLKSMRSALPRSWASELLKWFVVASDMLQTFYLSPNTVLLQQHNSLYVLFEMAWLVGFADISSRQVVEECKDALQKPRRFFSGLAHDEYGFFCYQSLARKFGRFSFVLSTSLVTYLITENPVYTLMAMVNGMQSSAVANGLRLSANRYRFSVNQSAKREDMQVSPKEVRVVWASKKVS